MWRIAALAVVYFLTTGMMSINDEPPASCEIDYINEVMPFTVIRVDKKIALTEVEFYVHMFRGAEHVGVTVKLYTPYSFEMFQHAVRLAAVAAGNSVRWSANQKE